MDFGFTPQQETFRQEIRDFLKRDLSPEMLKERGEVAGVRYSKAFSRKLGQKGWIGLAWPKEYGGRGLGHIEQLIYLEEMVLNGAPIGYHYIAERQMGPSIILFGTEEQKRWFLPRIARGEMSICIGYSEPEAGSDLASLQTKAVADGDDYIVNGSKIWNSAHNSEWIWLAARTNQDVPKHRGISVFLVDLGSPGIAIETFANMANEHSFALVTFDNVRVPKRMMVGERDKGWYVVAANLDFERAGIERVAVSYPILREFVAFIKETGFNGKPIWQNPEVKNRVAEMFIELEVGRLLAYKVGWMVSKGIVPNREATISKLFGSETTQRIASGMLEILGLYGQLDEGSKYAPLHGRILKAWYQGFSATVTAGTSEIMRNITATRGLGLPRAE